MKIAGRSTKLSKITTDLALILGLTDYVSFVVLFLGGRRGYSFIYLFILSVPLLLSHLIHLLRQHGKLSFAEC